MQVLTLKAVKAAARKYYKARKLTAQHRDPDSRRCSYAIGSYRCAIGASLSKKTLEAMRVEPQAMTCPWDTHRNGAAIVMGSFFTLSEKDAKAIEDIQSLHDQWCDASRDAALHSDDYSPNGRTVASTRNAFLAAIGLRK